MRLTIFTAAFSKSLKWGWARFGHVRLRDVTSQGYHVKELTLTCLCDCGDKTNCQTFFREEHLTWFIRGTPRRTFPVLNFVKESKLELLRNLSPRTRDPLLPNFGLFSESLVDPERRRVGCLSQLYRCQNPFEKRKTRDSEGPAGSRVHSQGTNFSTR